MKLRTLLPLLLLALAAIAGTAMAVDADVTEAPVPAPAETQIEQPVEPEALPDVLPELRPELNRANPACCIADCYTGFDQCTASCGTQACFQACRQDLAACRQSC